MARINTETKLRLHSRAFGLAFGDLDIYQTILKSTFSSQLIAYCSWTSKAVHHSRHRVTALSDICIWAVFQGDRDLCVRVTLSSKHSGKGYAE